MNSLDDTSESASRLILVVVLPGVSSLCVFVFLAAFEPGNGVLGRIGYGTAGCGSMSGAIALSAWGGRHKVRAIILGSGLFFLAVLLFYLYPNLH
jgi:hypothetical protein